MPERAIHQRLEGQVIGGCRLIRRIAVGGMADVYLAEQIRAGDRPVAVKILRLGDIVTQQGISGRGRETSDDIATRFLSEAKLLASLHHPNILPVHDSGEENGRLYLVMQHAADGSLAAALGGHSSHPLHPPLDLPLALDVLSQVAAALQHTHNHDIVHRDVKPANVLLHFEPDGNVRAMLADFGVAQSVDATAHLNEVTGTIAYMAPEQFQGYFSPASDQYSLAVMAYLLLTGRVPFEGDIAAQMYAHVHLPPLPLQAFNPRVPLSVSGTIVRGLAKSPEQRYPSVAAFAEALHAGAEPMADTTILGAPLLEPESIDASQTNPVSARGSDGPIELLPHPRGSLRSLGQAAPMGAGSPARGDVWNEHHDEWSGAVHSEARMRERRMPAKRKLGLLVGCLALLLLAVLVDVGLRQHGSVASGSTGRDVIAVHATVTRSPAASPPQKATPTSAPTMTPSGASASSDDGASVTSPIVTETAQPGQRLSVGLAMRNSGASTWASADGYALTCDTVRHPDASCTSAWSIGIGDWPIAPGVQVQFALDLTAPTTPGRYSLWMDMEHNGTLFSSPDAQVVLIVAQPQSQPTATPSPQPTPAGTPSPQPTPPATPSPTAPTLPPTAAPASAESASPRMQPSETRA